MKHGPNPRRGRSRGNGKRHPGIKNNFESNGPDVKIRGTAQQVLEKYLALGRDAASSGDRIMAESYFQHAEHYYRIQHLGDAQNGPPGSRRGRPQGQPNEAGGQSQGEHGASDAEEEVSVATEAADEIETTTATPPAQAEAEESAPAETADDSGEAERQPRRRGPGRPRKSGPAKGAKPSDDPVTEPASA